MKTILLAVDSDGLAEAVVPAVAAVARAEDARVVALHVTDASRHDEMFYNATQVLSDVVVRLVREGVPATAEVREGASSEVADQIAATAAEFRADLIALGSHGRGDVVGLILGSVGHKVMGLTRAPLLIARPGREGGHRLQRLLVAIDGSVESEMAVTTAIELASAAGAELHFVHALVSVVVEGGAYFEPRAEAETALRRRVDEAKAKGVKASILMLDGWQSVAHRLAEAAVECDADLVVVGSRRLGELAGIVRDSTSHALLTESDRPVLVAGRPR